MNAGSLAQPVVLCRGTRLARTLRRDAADEQLAAGRTAWASPLVYPLDTYLNRAWARFGSLKCAERLLSDAEARYVFRDCVAAVADDALAGPASQAADALYRSYRLTAAFGITPDTLARSAYTADQRVLAAVAGAYTSRLVANGWIDPAELPSRLAGMRWPDAELPADGFELAGFLTWTPTQQQLFEHWQASGCDVRQRSDTGRSGVCRWLRPGDDKAELLQAGQWARDELAANPDGRFAVIVPGLATAAEAIAALFADGLRPGWQLAPDDADWHVSYGSSLSDYPLIAARMRVLAARGRPMPFAALSELLRDPLLLPEAALGELAVLERSLRAYPERRWRVADVVDELEQGTAAHAAMAALAHIEAALAELGRKDSPRGWAGRFAVLSESLETLAGYASGTVAYQLNNAVRETLNSLAALDRVEPLMSGATALATWQGLVRSTLFQIENTGARVDLLGPLEAVGHRYDKLFIARLDDEHWPPRITADPFINRRLQAEHGMPGTDPASDLEFSDGLLASLVGSAGEVILSAPQQVGDVRVGPAPAAVRIAGTRVAAERQPRAHFDSAQRDDVGVFTDADLPLAVDEDPSGGWSLIATTMESAFAAFVRHRLHAEPLPPPTAGFGHLNRGNVLHRAAELTYRPTLENGVVGDAAQAVAHAFRRYRRHRDQILHRLLDAEEQRALRLIEALLDFDATRSPFRVLRLEEKTVLRLGGLSLSLRIDRLDETSSGAVLIDYKTGAGDGQGIDKSTGLPRQLQLAVYAAALAASDAQMAIGALATLRLHTRGVEAAGVGFAAEALPLASRFVTKDNAAALISTWTEALAAIAATFERGCIGFDAAAESAPEWFYWRALAGDAQQ